MPVLVLIIFALFGAAIITGVIYLAGFFGHAYWAGQLPRISGDNIKAITVYAFEMALLHAVLLGTPAFFGLYRLLERLKAWVCMLTGLVIGAVPSGIRSWPVQPHPQGNVTISVLRGGKLVQTVVNGVPTLAGWLDYGWNVLNYAALGALGGLVFWALWQMLQPALQRMPTRR